MHHLTSISYAILGLGLLIVVAALVGGLPSVWTLVGLMLLVAGVVKIVVVLLWRYVAQLEEPNPPDEA